MPGMKRIYNIFRYGVGSAARKRKKNAKSMARQKKFESQRWQSNGELVQRNYDCYDDYVNHQTAKLDKIIHRLREKETEDLNDFKRRFEQCSALHDARTVLCLGARIGTEVEALLELGYFAVGVDLNPGAGNPYVLSGDFHQLVFPDNAIDVVYTNALDHAFNLDKVISEVTRVLRPGGYFIADIIAGYQQNFVPGEYEAMHWKDTSSMSDMIANCGALKIDSTRDLGYVRRDQWFQTVFQVSA